MGERISNTKLLKYPCNYSQLSFDPSVVSLVSEDSEVAKMAKGWTNWQMTCLISDTVSRPSCFLKFWKTLCGKVNSKLSFWFSGRDIFWLGSFFYFHIWFAFSSQLLVETFDEMRMRRSMHKCRHRHSRARIIDNEARHSRHSRFLWLGTDLPICLRELRDEARTGRQCGRRDECTLHTLGLVLSRRECKPGINFEIILKFWTFNKISEKDFIADFLRNPAKKTGNPGGYHLFFPFSALFFNYDPFNLMNTNGNENYPNGEGFSAHFLWAIEEFNVWKPISTMIYVYGRRNYT